MAYSIEEYKACIANHRTHIADNIYGDIEPIRMVTSIPILNIEKRDMYTAFWYTYGSWDRFTIRITHDFGGNNIHAKTPSMCDVLDFIKSIAEIIGPDILKNITEAMFICKTDPENEKFFDILTNTLIDSGVDKIISKIGNIPIRMMAKDKNVIIKNDLERYFPTVKASIVGSAVLTRMHCHADVHSLCPERPVYKYGDENVIDSIRDNIDSVGYKIYGSHKWSVMTKDICKNVEKYERNCNCMICNSPNGKFGIMMNDMERKRTKLHKKIKDWEIKNEVQLENGHLDLVKLGELDSDRQDAYFKLCDIYKKHVHLIYNTMATEGPTEEEIERQIQEEINLCEYDIENELERYIGNTIEGDSKKW